MHARILIKLARGANKYGWMNTCRSVCLLSLVSGKGEYQLVTVSFPWLDSPDWRCRSSVTRNSTCPNARTKCTHECIRPWEIMVFNEDTLATSRKIKNSYKKIKQRAWSLYKIIKNALIVTHLRGGCTRVAAIYKMD